MKLNLKCDICGKHFTINVKESEYHAYTHGIPAIQAFPTLSYEDREQLHSHLCSDCYSRIFNARDFGVWKG